MWHLWRSSRSPNPKTPRRRWKIRTRHHLQRIQIRTGDQSYHTTHEQEKRVLWNQPLSRSKMQGKEGTGALLLREKIFHWRKRRFRYSRPLLQTSSRFHLSEMCLGMEIGWIATNATLAFVWSRKKPVTYGRKLWLRKNLKGSLLYVAMCVNEPKNI